MSDDNDAVQEALRDASAGLSKVSDDRVNTISNLAFRQLSLQAQVEEAEAKLANLQSQLKQVQEIDLPTAMIEQGMRSFTLKDGSSITIKKIYGAGITVDNRPAAHRWLDENGHSALIKCEVAVIMGKGKAQRDAAQTLMRKLGEQGYSTKLTENVHPQTLKAFAREQLEKGVELPPSITVFQGEKALISIKESD